MYFPLSHSLTVKVDVLAKEKEVVYDEGSKYVTVFDPLDGSSNVDAGIPTGESHQFCIKVNSSSIMQSLPQKVSQSLNVHIIKEQFLESFIMMRLVIYLPF